MSYTNGLDKPSDYFNTKLFVGSGSTQSITGVGFQPDWVWIKQRNTSRFHYLFDSVRGATKKLHSNSSDAESTLSTTLSSFDSDGYTVETDAGVNQSSGTYASWNWLGGGTGVSNTDGSITSTVSANTTSGFSIVTYTGAGGTQTIGHGLGATLGLVIVKRRTGGTNGWVTWHNALTGLQYVLLDNTSAGGSSSTIWNSTTPTSSVFSVGTSAAMNASGSTYVAYCFAEKKGFSKFGSYTSISSHDANFVYLGFKPAMIIFKSTSFASDWHILDRTRYTFNSVNEAVLEPNTSDAESYTTFGEIDFLSNGFKIRNNNAISGGGYEHIYMAFAENPFVTSTGIPATAR